MLSQEQTCPERSRRKQQLRQDLPRLALASSPTSRSGSGKAGKKEKIIRIRKTLSEMTEDQRRAVTDKFGIVTVEGHLLTPHNQCFLVAQSEINFSIVGGFSTMWESIPSGEESW